MIKNFTENERESLGEFLRRTREEQGLSLEEVAETTKISLNNLKAIEEDDYANLPAEVFVRGFCGIYAAHLSLDPETVREHFNQQKLNMPRRSTKRTPTPTQLALETSSMAERPAVNSHSVVGLSLLAIFIVVTAICWYLSWNPATFISQKLRGVAEPPTGTTEQQDATDNTTEHSSTTEAASVTEQPANKELAEEKPAVVAPTVPIATPPAVAPAATREATEKEPSPASTSPAPATQALQPAQPPQAVQSIQPPQQPAPNTYLLKATTRQATQLTIKVDENPAERIALAAGENRSWNAAKSMVITLPAGTGTTFTLNDIPLNLPKKPAGEEITVSIPEYLLE